MNGNQRYLSAVLTAIAVLLGLHLVKDQGTAVQAARAQPETPEQEGLISAAEQRKQILLELKAVGARVDKLQKALEAGVKVKVISMPEAKKEGA